MTDEEPSVAMIGAISQVLYRYCRGVDRMDGELTRSCFTADAILDYTSLYKGDAAGFVDWLWPIHAAMTGHTHSISNVLVETPAVGEYRSEAYVMTTLRMPLDGDVVDLVSTGRYLDRWHADDTGWRIAHRLYLGDLFTVRPVLQPDLSSILPRLPGPRTVHASRDEHDPSYAFLIERSPQ